MVRRRERREPHTQHRHLFQVHRLGEEVQRHEGAVVDLGLGGGRSCHGDGPPGQAVGHGLGELGVAAGGHGDMRLPELGHRAGFLLGVGDEEAVAVERRMGGDDDDDVRIVGRCAPRDLLVGDNGVGNLRFLAVSHGRNNQRRVGNSISGKKAHGTPSSSGGASKRRFSEEYGEGWRLR